MITAIIKNYKRDLNDKKKKQGYLTRRKNVFC